MGSGERLIGAAKGKQPNTEALCQPPPPPPTCSGGSSIRWLLSTNNTTTRLRGFGRHETSVISKGTLRMQWLWAVCGHALVGAHDCCAAHGGNITGE